MKTHSDGFKTQIGELGRELDVKVSYTIDEEDIELGNEELNSITPHYKGALLKSVMKQLDIDSNVDIPLETQINAQFGLKVNGEYEYLNYGNYIVYSSEKQEDTYSYKIVAYDKLLYAMKKYEGVTGTFPMTIRSYIEAICTKLGLTFKNASDTFTNYNQTLDADPYLDSKGLPLDYTYRDILDELAQVTASTICLDENDEVEVRYINYTEGKNKININGTIVKRERASYENISTNNNTLSYNVTNNTAGYLGFVIPLEIGETYVLSYIKNYEEGNYIYVKDLDEPITEVGTNYGTERNSGYTFIATTPYLGVWLYANMINNEGHASVSNLMIRKQRDESGYEPYGDTIDEEYLKDVNVNFGEKYGGINSVVLTRSGGADSIALTDESSIENNGLYEIKIEDNQILNGNNRGEYLQEIYDKLHGLEYYINDFTSTGICYYDLCDRYNVKVGDNYYSCVMFNDEIDISQGIEEKVYTEKPEDSETDYTKVDKTDRALKQTYIIVDKQNQTINSVVQTTNNLSNVVDEQGNQIDALGTQITQTMSQIRADVTTIQNTLENGVSLVKTTSVTINDAGLNVSTTNSKISTTMSNNAFTINGSGTDTFIGYDEIEGTSKAQMDNLRVVNHLTAGCHRTQAVYLDNEWRTCDFYVGRSN